MSLRNQMLFGVGVLLVSVASVAWAGDPVDVGQGMGTVQPVVRDLSLDPHWHIYRFVRDGIEYLQINDEAGQVHVGLGVANGVFIVLPMGSDAGNVVTPGTTQTAMPPTVETVYQDAQVELDVGVNSSGHLVWIASPATSSMPQGKFKEDLCDPNSCPINRVRTALPPSAGQ